MYETDNLLKQPKKPDQYLWKYYAENRLLELLHSSELFFTHVPTFADGFEGLLPAKTRASFIRWCIANGSAPAKAAQEATDYEKMRDDFYASCWHVNDHESYLMWKVYANDSRGYAVRTTFERIQAAFDGFPGIIRGGSVEYVDFTEDDVGAGYAFDLVTTKDLPYRDESEFRLFFWNKESPNNTHPTFEDGVKVPVDLSFLVECLYVSPIIGQPSDLVQQALRQHNIKWTSSSIQHSQSS